MTIKLSSFGGSGGFPIDGVLPLNSNSDLYDKQGLVFLRSGVIENNPSLYPNAQVDSLVYSGVEFSASEGESGDGTLAWDGTYFWISNAGNDTIFQYDSLGVYTGVSIGSIAYAMFGSGSTLWVANLVSKEVVAYDGTGTPTGFSFSFAGEVVTATGLVWDGTYFWVADSTTAYQYDSSGAYTAVNKPLDADGGSVRGIAWDGTYFWANHGGDIGRYDSNMENGVFVKALVNAGDSRGLAFDGVTFYTLDLTGFEIKKYAEAVGLELEKTDTDTGLTIYVRVG